MNNKTKQLDAYQFGSLISDQIAEWCDEQQVVAIKECEICLVASCKHDRAGFKIYASRMGEERGHRSFQCFDDLFKHILNDFRTWESADKWLRSLERVVKRLRAELDSETLDDGNTE